MNIQLVHLPLGDPRLSEALLSVGLKCVAPDCRARILRFRHSDDKWRCMIGRLLPRIMLTDRGVRTDSIVTSISQSGKPFISEPPGYLSFNVTHDSDFVAMAYSRNKTDIGIDIMKCELPHGETVESYLNVLSGSLTPHENDQLKKHINDPTLAIDLLYEYWTIKEAYTKALGIGLGFDFTRIEYRRQSEDPNIPSITVDGSAIKGWQIRGLRWIKDGTRYVCVAAMFLDTEDDTRVSWTVLDERAEWVQNIDVFSLLARAHPLAT